MTYIPAYLSVSNDAVDARIDSKINVNPVALGQSVNVPKNTPFSITLQAVDADNNITGYAYGQPINGVASGTIPEITYTPNTDYVGTDSIPFTATDADGNTSGTGSISVNVYDVSNSVPYVHTFVPADFVAPSTPDGRLYFTVTQATHGKGVFPVIGKEYEDDANQRSRDVNGDPDDGFQIANPLDDGDLVFSVLDGKAFGGKIALS